MAPRTRLNTQDKVHILGLLIMNRMLGHIGTMTTSLEGETLVNIQVPEKALSQWIEILAPTAKEEKWTE